VRIAIAAHRFPPYLGGAELYSAKLVDSLMRLGHHPLVFTTHHPGRSADTYPVVSLRRLAVPGSGYIIWPGVFGPGALRAAAACDVLHAVSFSMFGTLAWLLIGRWTRRPLVVTAFYHPPSANPRPTLNTLYDRTIGPIIANGCDAIIFHSSAERLEFEQHVGARGRGRVYQIMSPSTLSGIAPNGSFRRRIGHDGFLVLFVGRIDSHKGVQTLLRAAAELDAEGALPDLAVAIVGPLEEWFDPPAELRALRRQLEHRVHFLGPLHGADLAAAYAESDVTVMASLYESYGLVIVESLSYGTPVISTRTGIALDLVRPDETGFLYDYEDVAELKRALHAAHRHARTMRTAARSAVDGLSWDRTAAATVSVYLDALRESTNEPDRH
jgi:glycosyltransferase involved in cell wall biosynthesis